MALHSFPTFFFFFFNDTATTEIYTLSLHDALPILTTCAAGTPSSISARASSTSSTATSTSRSPCRAASWRSEEHTSELQSQSNLVCRLLLEKKKKKQTRNPAQQLDHLNKSAVESHR